MQEPENFLPLRHIDMHMCNKLNTTTKNAWYEIYLSFRLGSESILSPASWLVDLRRKEELDPLNS